MAKSRITISPTDAEVDGATGKVLSPQSVQLTPAGAAGVAMKQLELAKEALKTVSAVVSYFRTKEEWRGKVRVQELRLEEALARLEKAKLTEGNRAEELRQLWAMREPCIQLCQSLLKELASESLPDVRKDELRRQVLEAMEKLAQLKS